LAGVSFFQSNRKRIMRKAHPQHRRCEGPCCDRVFVPQQRRQRYCSPGCRNAAYCRRLNGDADTLAQISAKMLNEVFYIYNEHREVLIKKSEEPAV
jgi:hypothetical protein